VQQFRIDSYVFETLMPDLVLHDHQPSAFLVYLQLWYRTSRRRGPLRLSHQEIADATGLSKSAVQAAVRTLTRRRLIRASRESATAVPAYTVLRPWRGVPKGSHGRSERRKATEPADTVHDMRTRLQGG
jgi:DNA-binding transcriptional MocR family regulator